MPNIYNTMNKAASWAINKAKQLPLSTKIKIGWNNFTNAAGEFLDSETGENVATGLQAALPALSSGNHMEAGDGIMGLGAFASTFNPIAGAVLSGYGHLMNEAFGSNVNWDTVDRYERNLLNYSRPNITAKDNTQLLNQLNSLSEIEPISRGAIGTQGWFNHDVDYAYNSLNKGLQAAKGSRARLIDDAITNVDKLNDARIAANYAAFGGPIFGYMSDGAIAYDMAKDNLMIKLMNAENKGTQAPATPFAKGGSLFNIFDTDISFVNAGGSHSENKLGGVPMGIAEDGNLNVVEEGETIFKNYVFSKRLPVPNAIRNKYKMRSTNFSDAFKEYFRKNGVEERPNDPIVKNGLLAFAADLMVSQEMVRAKRDNKKNMHMFPNGGNIGYDKSKTKENYFNALYAKGSDYMNALDWYNDPANVAERDALIADINAGKYDNGVERINGVTVTPDTWYGLATDYMKGPVHNAILANMAAIKDKLAAAAAGPTVAPTDTNANAAAANPGVTYQRVGLNAPVNDGLITLPDGRTFTPQEYERTFGVPAPVSAPSIVPEGAPEGSWTPEGIVRASGAIPLDDGSYLLAVPNGDGTVSPAPAAVNAGAGNNTTVKGNGNGALSVTDPYASLGRRYRMAGLLANAGALAYNLKDPYRPGVIDEIGDFVPIGGTPLGNYVPNFVMDTRYNANQQAQQAAATRNAMLNTTAPNKWANVLGADYLAQIAHGQMLRDDAIAQYDNLLKAATYNRETDKHNSGLDLDVAKANLSGKQANENARMQQRQYNVSNYDTYKRGKDAAVGAAITGVVDWLNANAKDKDALAMVGAVRSALASNEDMDLLYNYLSGVKPAKKSKKSKNNGEG